MVNNIPTDQQAAQTVTQQNQQSQQLASLVAQNQALIAQVNQSVEATKYLTVDPNSIKPPDDTPAPDDIVQKIKSAQLIQH